MVPHQMLICHDNSKIGPKVHRRHELSMTPLLPVCARDQVLVQPRDATLIYIQYCSLGLTSGSGLSEKMLIGTFGNVTGPSKAA